MKNVDIIREATAKAIESKVIKAGQELNTYNGWYKAGYQVKRGAKAKVTVALWTKKNGKFIKIKTALFSTAQVIKAMEPEPLKADDSIITETETGTETETAAAAAETKHASAIYDRNGNIFDPNKLPDVIVVHNDIDRERSETFKFRLQFFPVPKKDMKLVASIINRADDAEYIKAVITTYLLAEINVNNQDAYTKRCKANVLALNPGHIFENEKERPVVTSRKTEFAKCIVDRNTGKAFRLLDTGYRVSYRGYSFYISRLGRGWSATEERSGSGFECYGRTKSEIVEKITEFDYSRFDKIDFDELEARKLNAPIKQPPYAA